MQFPLLQICYFFFLQFWPACTHKQSHAHHRMRHAVTLSKAASKREQSSSSCCEESERLVRAKAFAPNWSNINQSRQNLRSAYTHSTCACTPCVPRVYVYVSVCPIDSVCASHICRDISDFSSLYLYRVFNTCVNVCNIIFLHQMLPHC